MATNSSVALLVRLEAKPGKEAEVATLLREARDVIDKEPATQTWFAVRFGPTSFGIFDTFPSENDRLDHLGGPVAAALQAHQELFEHVPVIEKCDVISWKIEDEAVRREAA